MANLEENNNTLQATSNVETADEIEQQQPTQQLPDESSGIVIASDKSKKATKRKTSESIKNENGDDGPLADHFRRFDGKYILPTVNLYRSMLEYSHTYTLV